MKIAGGAKWGVQILRLLSSLISRTVIIARSRGLRTKFPVHHTHSDIYELNKALCDSTAASLSVPIIPIARQLPKAENWYLMTKSQRRTRLDGNLKERSLSFGYDVRLSSEHP